KIITSALKRLSIFSPTFGRWRSLSAFLHDILAAIIAWIVAYELRFNFDIPPNFQASLLYVIGWAVPLQAVFFIGFGLYRGVWRFASIPDLRRIITTVFISAVAAGALLF